MVDTLNHYEDVVVCMFDGNYNLGFAALVNSLIKSGFTGVIYAGYRGNLPYWVNQLKSHSNTVFYINDDVIIQFELINTDMHLAYYKPFFIHHTFDRYPSAKRIFYFDVDIVVNAKWGFFLKWIENGVCLCLDEAFGFVHNNHPWRRDWKKLAKKENDFYSPVTFYVNSGFIGLTRKDFFIIKKWIELTNALIESGVNVKEINQSGENSYKGDQDLLNAVITVCPEIELSIIGTEGMGFTLPDYLMTHAVSHMKPWNKNFLKYLIINGNAPDNCDRNFFNYCNYPISVFSKSSFRFKKINLFVATVLGRIMS